MHDVPPTNDSGNSKQPRISRNAANWLFAPYVLCLVWNFLIGVYYALKLGSMMFKPTQSLRSIVLYLYHSDVIYLDAPALIYFFWGETLLWPGDQGKRPTPGSNDQGGHSSVSDSRLRLDASIG